MISAAPPVGQNSADINTQFIPRAAQELSPGMEHTAYQKFLKTHRAAAANPTVVQGEIEHFQAATADCQKYGQISQERYLRHEQHAKARMDQLGTLASAE